MVIPMVAAVALSYQTGATLTQKMQTVLPTEAEERWLQIPWRTNLMRARQEAQQQRKPLFLWIMNGHPLGCT